MPPLIPCADCGAHVFSGTCACPHCGSAKACYGNKLAQGAAALGLVAMLTACEGGEDTSRETGFAQPEYGVAITDNDGDGYDASEDCDDSDPAIHPRAEETPGDGVDSNCDGEDDT